MSETNQPPATPQAPAPPAAPGAPAPPAGPAAGQAVNGQQPPATEGQQEQARQGTSALSILGTVVMAGAVVVGVVVIADVLSGGRVLGPLFALFGPKGPPPAPDQDSAQGDG